MNGRLEDMGVNGTRTRNEKFSGVEGAQIRDTYLCKLCRKFFLIKVDLGQKFDSIVAAVFCRWAHRCGIVKFQGTTGIHMAVLGRWRAGKNFANEVDDSIAAGAKFSNDFELPRRILMVCEMLGGLVGD